MLDISSNRGDELGIIEVRGKISEKIWGGRTPEEILSKRFKLFVLLAVLLSGLFWIYRAKVGVGFLPNFEWFIPTLVVVGSLSLPFEGKRFWRELNRHFGIVVLVSVIVFDTLLFGLRHMPIFLFRWSGFIFVWILAVRNRISVFEGYRTLLGSSIVTAAVAILLFDFWTGVIGCGLQWGFSAAFIGQIPFTFYHLTSLLFVPPLVGLGKMLVRVKVPALSSLRVGAKAKEVVS